MKQVKLSEIQLVRLIHNAANFYADLETESMAPHLKSINLPKT